MKRANLFILFFLPNIIYSLGIKTKNITESWIYRKDTLEGQPVPTAILENNLSTWLMTKNFNFGIEVLYLREFHRDTSYRLIDFKKEAEIDIGIFNLILGDFSYSIGEGLCLGMQSIPLHATERRILGAKLNLKPKYIKMECMVGKPKNIERTNKKYNVVNDTNDIIASFNIYNTWGSINGTKIIMEDSLHTNLVGANYKFKSSLFSVYLEGVRKFGFDRIYYAHTPGYGIYSNLSLFIKEQTVIGIQLQRYNKLGVGGGGYRYNLFPTINSFNYSINDGLDETGVKIELQKGFKNLWLQGYHSQIFAPYEDKKEKKKFIENYLSIEVSEIIFTIKHLLQDKTGINLAFIKSNEFLCGISFPIKNIESTIEIKKANVITNTQNTTSFFDIIFSGNLPIKESIFLYYNYFWRNKQIIEDSPDTKWYGLGVKFEPSDKIFFDIYAGKEKGGFQCSGGVCRFVDPFEGIKLKLTLSI